MLVLVAGCVALVQQVLRLRWSRRGFLLGSALALVGALAGSLFDRGLQLPDLLQLRVDGEPFPLVWSLIGGALFATAIERIGRQPARGS